MSGGGNVAAERTAASRRGRLRVVKFGGSLFADDFPADRIATWIRQQEPSLTIAITGGGPWADAVRELDDRAQMPTAKAHRLAVRSMSLLTWLIAQADDRWRHVESWGELQKLIAIGTEVVVWHDVVDFLDRFEPQLAGQKLPIGWQTTSDSIACRIAQVLAADELVLVKSTRPPANAAVAEISELAEAGFVDQHFPDAARGFTGHIRFDECLRKSTPEET